MILLSTAFENFEAIPVKYTAEGEDLSPPLRWQGYEENPKFSQKAADVHPAMHYQHFSVSRMKKKKKE